MVRPLAAVGAGSLLLFCGLLLIVHNYYDPDKIALFFSRSENIQPLWRRSVVVMRHCARANPLEVRGPKNGFNNLNDYSAVPFPEWPVEKKYCLPLGADMIVGEGHSLNSIIHRPVSVIADANSRDIESAQRILEGLNENPTKFFVDGSHALFYPTKAGICADVSEQAKTFILERQINEVCPRTPEYDQLLYDMQEDIGRGRAPPLWTVPDAVVDGHVVGGALVGTEIAQSLLMQYAGGLEYGWGHIPVENVLKYTAITRRYCCIDHQNPLVVRGMSNLVAHILKNLKEEGDGSVIYVGHETQILGLAAFFHMNWGAPPFPSDVALPGSMLRFELVFFPGNKIEVGAFFDYSTLDPNSNGKLYSSPAVFKIYGRHIIYLDELENLISSRIDQDCVGKE